MPRNFACVGMLPTLLTVLLACPSVSAETIIINFTDRGWYKQDGLHDSTNLNYVVGDYRVGCTTACGSDFHNFFVFDLSSLSKPIASGTLALFVPNETQFAIGYISPNPSENYELHDVVTPISTLRAGTGGVASHADLGSGIVYGNRAMTEADVGKIIEITLNPSAIAAMNSNHGLFGIGGSITTLDGLANNEIVFGGSGRPSETTQLRLTLVPEPSTLLLLGIGAISLLGYRKSKSRG